MPLVVEAPVRIEAQGKPPKTIEEFIGLVSSKIDAVSIARMVSPPGWSEPGQAPDFDEFTVVLTGCLQVESRNGIRQIEAGQAVIVSRNEWVRYSTPEGAEYIAVCLPAFSPLRVHRDAHGTAI
jgi:mannose-6-phosphate isomerase-like protein (cupin superfamily)